MVNYVPPSESDSSFVLSQGALIAIIVVSSVCGLALIAAAILVCASLSLMQNKSTLTSLLRSFALLHIIAYLYLHSHLWFELS
jgi:hypothetical protein